MTGPDGKSQGERTWTFAPNRVRFDSESAGFVLDANSGKGWRYVAGGACTALGVPPTAAGVALPRGPEVERLEKILGDLGAGGTIVQRTTRETRTIAGVEATRVDFTRGGETIQERWFAVSVENKDFDALLLAWYGNGQLVRFIGLDDTQIAFQSVGHGYPVRAKDGRTGVVAEAVEIQRSPQPASAFTPPAGCPGR